MADTHTGSEGLAEPLTEREQEILTCLVEGLTNREIAERLHLAHRTVKWYNSQIYSKLGVSSRQAAIQQATTLGLVSVPSDDILVAEVRHNLPSQTTQFIGRQQELADLAQLIADPPTRLVTILAPGGMGKTRLGLAAAEGQLRHFDDGVFFVPLAPLSSPDAIATAIADSVGFSFYGDDPPQQQLMDYFHEREALLMLDNFEHLLDGALLVTDLLQAAPGMTVLATSREKLNLRGETVFTLSGLQFPDWETPDDALEYDAVKLFMQSAHQARPDYELNANDLTYLARLCRLTAGMPLALVLAAAWLDILTLEQLTAELQKGIDILETEQRDVPERQRSVRASFNYSWACLEETERRVFMKLSVFRGGFTAEAAQVVAGANLRQLRKLAGKALVGALPTGRYGVHELLRQYGEEQLGQAGEAETLQAAHRHYFAEFMLERGENIKGRRQTQGLNEIEADFDNVRTAWDHAIEDADFDALDRMGECLVLFCEMRARYKDAEDLFQHAVETLTSEGNYDRHPVSNRLRIYEVRAWLLQERHPIPEPIREQLTRSLDVARQQDDQMTIAWCLWVQGEFERIPFAYEAALGYYEHAMVRFRDLGNTYAIGRVLRGVAYSYQNMGPDYQQQHRVYTQQYLDWSRDIGDRAGTGHAIIYAGTLANHQGNRREAARLRQEAAAIWRETGDRKSLGFTIIAQSFQDLHRGQWVRARQAAEQLVTIGSDTNYALHTGVGLSILGFMAVVNGDYQDGQRLAREAMTHTAHIWAYDNGSERSLCIAALGQERYEEAKQRLLKALDVLNKEFRPDEATHWFAIAALILAHGGKMAQAVEILGLVHSQTEELTGWMAHWPLLADLKNDLEAELGAEAYAAAWRRGAQLDLETVVEELLAEFEDAAGK